MYTLARDIIQSKYTLARNIIHLFIFLVNRFSLILKVYDMYKS